MNNIMRCKSPGRVIGQVSTNVLIKHGNTSIENMPDSNWIIVNRMKDGSVLS